MCLLSPIVAAPRTDSLVVIRVPHCNAFEECVRIELHIQVFRHLLDDACYKLAHASSDKGKVCLRGHHRGAVCNPVRLVVCDRSSF